MTAPVLDGKIHFSITNPCGRLNGCKGVGNDKYGSKWKIHYIICSVEGCAGDGSGRMERWAVSDEKKGEGLTKSRTWMYVTFRVNGEKKTVNYKWMNSVVRMI